LGEQENSATEVKLAEGMGVALYSAARGLHVESTRGGRDAARLFAYDGLYNGEEICSVSARF
jgi:hypothetical protein